MDIQSSVKSAVKGRAREGQVIEIVLAEDKTIPGPRIIHNQIATLKAKT